MKIGDWPSTRGLDDTYRQVRACGLEENLAELDTFGFTVIPGDKLGTPDLFDRLRDAVLRVTHERTGIAHDLDSDAQLGKLKTAITYPNQLILFYLLVEDAAFREAICHPVLRPLLQSALGQLFQSSSCAAFVKSKGDAYGPGFGMHTDSAAFPEPLPAPHDAHVVNTNWILTDYTEENGPLCVVPGSHNWRRHPKPGEGTELVIPVDAPAGSVIMFHGNLWHGGLPKQTDGLRLSVNCYFVREYAKTQEDYRGVFAPEVLDEHGPYFAQLVGENDAMGWKSAEGPDADKFFKRIRL